MIPGLFSWINAARKGGAKENLSSTYAQKNLETQALSY